MKKEMLITSHQARLTTSPTVRFTVSMTNITTANNLSIQLASGKEHQWDPLRDQLSAEMNIVTTVLVINLIVFTIIGNVLTICAVCVDQRLRTSPSNIYIASLSVADLTVGSVVMTLMFLYSTSSDGRWHYGPIACDLWNFIDYVACTASLTNVCAITIDRYRSVSQPLQAISRRSHKRALLESTAAWLFPVIFWSLLIIIVRNISGHPNNSCNCQLLSHPQYVAVICAVVAVNVPIALIIVFFTAILCSLRRQLGKHQATKTSSSLLANFKQRPAGATITLQNINWDADEARTIEMMDVTSQNGRAVTFSVDSVGSLDQYSCTEHRQRTDSEETDDTNGRGSDGGVFRNLLGGERLLNTPCLRRVKLGYAKSSNVVRDDETDDSEDDGSEERIKIVRLCTEEIMESMQSDSRLSASGSKENNSDSETLSLATLPGSQPVLLNYSPALSARPLHMCNSDPTVSVHFQRAVMAEQTDSAGRLPIDANASSNIRRQSLWMSQRTKLHAASLRTYAKLLCRRRQDSIERARVRQQLRAAVTLGMITLCMLFCWLPFSIVWPWRVFCPSCVPNYIYDVATWVNYANSAINPCIYCLTNPLYRQAFRRIFVRFLCKRHRK